jgi:Ca2+-binding EF-hand superfamily protein
LINPNELFSFFDIKKEHYINKDNFISIFNKHFNIQIKEEDFLYLIKKYDFDKDDKLNYEEFNHMISPISIINPKTEEKNFENNLCTVKIYNKEQENSIKDLFIKLIKLI